MSHVSPVVNQKLWNQVKAEAKKKFQVWPSAYASGWLSKEYKKRGGTFQGKSDSTLRRWFAEKWIDVCYWPKKVPCGRTQPTGDRFSDDQENQKYPYCRPSKKISKQTPKLAQDMKPATLKKLCQQKHVRPHSRAPSQSKK